EVAMSRSYYSPQISVYGNFSYALFKALTGQSGKSIPAVVAQLKSGQPNSFPLTAAATISYTSTYQDIVSYNVVGKIEGTDPRLKNEYVVHSAHLDHLGVGVAAQGDSIYNGAHEK